MAKLTRGSSTPKPVKFEIGDLIEHDGEICIIAQLHETDPETGKEQIVFNYIVLTDGNRYGRNFDCVEALVSAYPPTKLDGPITLSNG